MNKNSFINNIHIFSNTNKLRNKEILFYGQQNLDKLSLDEKFQVAYSKISKNVKNIPEIIIYCNLSYEKISNSFINKNLKKFIFEGCDTLIPVIKDYSINWNFNEQYNDYVPISKNFKSRKFKKPILKSLFGLGTVTNFVNLKIGDLISGNYHFNIVENQKISLRN